MKTKQRCPECEQGLDKNSNECYCGWKTAFSNQSYEADHQCAYAISGQRCPLVGTNNFSTHGGGSWYCIDHYHNLNDKQRCQEIIAYAWENFESIMDSRIDWRVKLIPEEYAIRKNNIKKLFETLKNRRR